MKSQQPMRRRLEREAVRSVKVKSNGEEESLTLSKESMRIFRKKADQLSLSCLRIFLINCLKDQDLPKLRATIIEHRGIPRHIIQLGSSKLILSISTNLMSSTGLSNSSKSRLKSQSSSTTMQSLIWPQIEFQRGSRRLPMIDLKAIKGLYLLEILAYTRSP